MEKDIIGFAKAVFDKELSEPPLITLRGGNALDSYEQPPPFDQALDQPTDAYLEKNYWGLAHLDSMSWKHYLPRFIEFAIQHISVPNAMPVEALLASLRPPDREPPRFGALTQEQREVIVTFLDVLAFEGNSAWQEEAILALEEYWAPGALYGGKS